MSKASDFYLALELALHNYAKSRLNIQTADTSKEKIEALLIKNCLEKETVGLFIKVLTNCEFARYAPSTQIGMQQDYEKAVTAITKMDKQFRS